MVDEDKLSEVLGEFARTVITDFPIQAILDHLVQRIVGVLPVTAAGVTLISRDRRPEYVAASDDSALRFEQLQSDLDEGPCLVAYGTGEAVAIADLAEDEQFPRFTPAAIAEGLAAVFTCPLRHGDVSIGALDLYRSSPGPLDEEDMSAAQTLADVAAAYLLNARAREEAQAASNAFHHNSLHDPLTGLPNRQLLADRLAHATARAKRSHTKAAILFVDLDQFKRVNDRHGHHIGDALLLAVTGRLSALVRAGDTLARVSGDEFVIFCEEISAASDAEVLAERITESFEMPFTIMGRTVAITASIGIAFAGPGEAITDALIVEADLAMYQVKRRGGVGHQVIDARHSSAATDDDILEADLRSALADDALDVAYQPIVRTSDRVMVGVEALLRWAHPVYGHVDPPVVIAAAERSGMIDDVGEWVLRRACRDHRRWMDAHLGESLDLSVNVSIRQLLHPAFASVVIDALAATETDPALLTLELAENVFIENSDQVAEVLGTLTDVGVRIALDDYGTGYASLGYLVNFPIHTIKIDRCFVTDLPAETNRIIVASITTLAHDLGLCVVAEGVETVAQHDVLAAVECGLAQGYLYGRPVPADDIAALLTAHPPALVTP